MGYAGYGLRCGFFLPTASHNPWRGRTAMHACVQSWEWPGHNTRVLQPTGHNSLVVCHQGLSLHVSCPQRLAVPEHPSTATRPEGHLESLRSHRHRASPLLITCWGWGPGRTYVTAAFVAMAVSWNVCPSGREQPRVPAGPVTAAIQSQANGQADIAKSGLPLRGTKGHRKVGSWRGRGGVLGQEGV